MSEASDPVLYEGENDEQELDPEYVPVSERKVVTQPFDLAVNSLIGQIEDTTLHMRPTSERPKFQRRYIWPKRLASRLIESILLNVPIPPCYFSQNEDFELDVIDGQQRLYSIFRFVDNQFGLVGLEAFNELNGKRFFELDASLQRKIQTHALRCVVITNDSHPEVKFDVFERLNTNTVPLNAQELRNCIYRGALNDLLSDLAEYPPWLQILRRKTPDKRLRDEELILRFFAFHTQSLDSYRTPQKHWLNEVASQGRTFSRQKINSLSQIWRSTLDNCLEVFSPDECFRRGPNAGKPKVVNRALIDLTMSTMAKLDPDEAKKSRTKFRKLYFDIQKDEEFNDLIGRAVDHRSRTLRRFKIWNDRVQTGIL